MNKRLPARKQIFGMLSAALTMSILFQILRGWDPKVFWTSLLINTLAVVTLWRYRTFASTSRQHGNFGGYGFVARVVFWIVVAVALFFAFRTFE
jgi:hypothetical protein